MLLRENDLGIRIYMYAGIKGMLFISSYKVDGYM